MLKQVANEDVKVLFEAITQIWSNGERDDEGMFSGEFWLEPRLGDPFLRAMLRIEAELLLQDADAIGTDREESRTQSQRSADALVALALRVCDALV